MTTVQVAIGDHEYAETIAALLRREGRYRLLLASEPDLTLAGVIVLDCDHLERLGGAVTAPERCVLVTGKDPEKLAQLWNAGIRHVVFREDPPNTLQLAVSAAELRQARGSGARRLPHGEIVEGPRPVAHRRHHPGSSCDLLHGCDGRRCMVFLHELY